MDDELVVMALIESSERIGEEKVKLRKLRDKSDPFTMPEHKFRKIFRFPRQSARNLIETIDCAELQMGSLPKHLKVLCALHFFSQGSYQASLGQDNQIAFSQPSVSRAVTVVTNLILRKLTPQKIKFPKTEIEKDLVKAEFLQIYGMPNTLGAVDGTHIGIVAPPLTHPTAPGNLFYNRKGFCSINCQVICGAKGVIMSINPNYPGSTHDAAVFRASNINKYLKRLYIQGNQNEWLLGDKGYPLLPWLMTPLHNTASAPEERYNKCHTQARNIIEKTFGRLKNKFRCLIRHRILHYSPEKAAKIIVCCCTLHNLLLEVSSDDDDDYNDEVNRNEVTNDNIIEEDYTDFLAEARSIQHHLINTHFR